MATALDVMDRPWKWGEADCCTAACDVFLRLYGIDPMARLRGKYATRREANRLIEAFGGFEPMASFLAEEAGLRPVDHVPGAVAVATLPGGWQALTICLAPDRFVGKTRTGLTTVGTKARCYHVG